MITNWDSIIVHHSATPDGVTLDLETIYRIHVLENGWRDIGYQALVDMVNGKPVGLYGRPITQRGSHAGKDWNGRALGICFIGNYSIDTPSHDMLECGAQRIIRPWMRTFDIPLKMVKAHRDTKATECPGKNFDMQQLKRLI